MNDTLPQTALDFLDKSFADTSKNTQLVANSSNNEELNKKEFLTLGEAFWQLKGNNYYQRGMLLGRGDGSNILFQEFLKKFRKMLEEIIREELRVNNQTSETFKEIFKILESSFNLLNNTFTALNITVKNERFMPMVHGFIDSYINTIMSNSKNG